MNKPHSVEISIRTAGKAMVVDLEGRIDVTTSTIFRSKLFETLPQTSRLALNMSGVHYIDSAGIATLVEIQMKARQLDKQLALFGLGTRVHDVLKLTRLLGYFQIFDSEEQAVAGDEASHG
jgi:anti-sigma B factor antagonist